MLYPDFTLALCLKNTLKVYFDRNRYPLQITVGVVELSDSRLFEHSFIIQSALEFIIKERDSQDVNNDNTKNNFEVKSLAGGRQR